MELFPRKFYGLVAEYSNSWRSVVLEKLTRIAVTITCVGALESFPLAHERINLTKTTTKLGKRNALMKNSSQTSNEELRRSEQLRVLTN